MLICCQFPGIVRGLEIVKFGKSWRTIRSLISFHFIIEDSWVVLSHNVAGFGTINQHIISVLSYHSLLYINPFEDFVNLKMSV